jgi:hypothetical protein
MGLGFMGKGMGDDAKKEFEESVRLNLNNVWAKEFLLSGFKFE